MLTISGTGAVSEKVHDSYFYYGNKIKTVIVRSGITEIGDHAFDGFNNMTEISLPDTVTRIGQQTFSDCWSLTHIRLPDGVTEIGSYAFGGCGGLRSIYIGSNVTKIEDNAFSNCSILGHVLYGGSESDWEAIGINDSGTGFLKATRHYNCTGDEVTDAGCIFCDALSLPTTEATAPTEPIQPNDTQDGSYTWIILAAAIILLGGVAGILLWKKKH